MRWAGCASARFSSAAFSACKRLDLARPVEAGRWELRDDVEAVLRSLGERKDIIRTMQRAFGSEQREFAIAEGPDIASITGRIVAKGLSGEAHDKPYVIVDGLDGRAHHVSLHKATGLEDLPVGGVVEVRRACDSIADRNVAAIAEKGWYVRKTHFDKLRGQGCDRDRAADIVEGHVRRLEALRRAGIAKRVADGVWEVPADLIERGRAYDHRRHGGTELELHSQLPVEKQIRTVGVTWLDRQLLDRGASGLTTGFGAATRQAVRDRVDFLVEQGLAEKRDDRVRVVPNLLNTLRDREIASAADRIHRQTGLTHRPVKDGARVSGVYRQSVQLSSGRFAMLSDGFGFELVPWRPVIENSLGRTIGAVVRGDHVAWNLGRQRGLSL